MSYITQVGTIAKQEVLEAKQEKLLSDIRKIVGGKKFTFSDRYLKKYSPNIGDGERPINGITKKYVYVSCFLEMRYNESKTEFGAVIKKFPICYQHGCGSFVDKVELEDLFIADLDKILRELKFYLWWESEVQLPKVKKEYQELLELEKKYSKMLNEVGLDEDMEETWKQMIRE